MKLPEKVDKFANKIKRDNISGAHKILSMTLDMLENLVSEYNKENLSNFIKIVCTKFFRAQPTMAMLANYMALIIKKAGEISINQNNHIKIKNEVLNLISELKRKNKIDILKISEYTSNMLKNKKNILTYSFSSTIFEAIKYQKNLGNQLTIYITESRPICEGLIGAIEFSKMFNTKLYIDAAIGHILKEENIDVILIGADSFTENKVVNKIGTLPIAITAQTFNVPVYVLAQSYKYYSGANYNIPIMIEKKPSSEIYKSKDKNLTIENYYFDKTPIKFITGIITELGEYNLNEQIALIKKTLPINILKYLYSTI